MKLFKLAVVVALVSLLASPVMASVTVKHGVSHNNDEVSVIDVGNAGYVAGGTLYLGFTSIQGTSTMVSGTVAIPVAYNVVHKTIGQSGDSTGTLADGTVGQVLYIDVASNAGAYNFTVTPTTKTGFTTFALNATNGYIVLMFVDTSIGWVKVDSKNVTLA